MVLAFLQNVVRSAPLRPVRNLLRPLASRWAGPVAVHLACGYDCFVDLRSCHGRGLLVTGEFDPALGRFIESVLRPGSVFLDVGANLGYFSLLALARVGTAGAVHAFEMEARSLRCLELTKKNGKLDNLFVHPNAVGDREGNVGLVDPGEMYQCWVNPDGKGIRMRPLDSWLPELDGKPVQLIKIDVEGMEYQVLEGAREILRRHRPVVVTEVVPANMSRFQQTPQGMADFMASLGYDRRELEGTHDTNWIFTPQQ